MKFIKNDFFKQLCDFFDFSDTKVLDTTLTNSELNVEIVILSDVETVNLTVELLISKTSFFIIVLEAMIKLDKTLIENSIDFVFLIIVSSIFSSESDIKSLLNKILNEIIISFFF